MKKILIVIPARYASTRFPGKPLAILAGKPVIQWVWDRVTTLGHDTIVATDDPRIVQAVENFGGKAMLTSDKHRSGTDRCGEVLQRLESDDKHYDLVINVQGDEPFTRREQLQSLIDTFNNNVQIATLKTSIKSTEELLTPNNVKVICNPKGCAIYFSRHPLPYLRGKDVNEWLSQQPYFKHVGIYAFRTEVLKHIVTLPPSALEQSESLEQLRWIENGYTIQVAETETANIGIDTPEDLVKAQQVINHLEN